MKEMSQDFLPPCAVQLTRLKKLLSCRLRQFSRLACRLLHCAADEVGLLTTVGVGFRTVTKLNERQLTEVVTVTASFDLTVRLTGASGVTNGFFTGDVERGLTSGVVGTDAAGARTGENTISAGDT